ncbi:MAG: ATP-binding cassette domain-containing protein [Planctomycetes bacterium]|nr:ATP-binding cassette domain-containing protein [Planctomycetota bacterium]
MISVRDLSKVYGNATAIQGVSFQVARGEILGFLGPNGAGKTTTMRILTCAIPPSGGTAEVEGRDIRDDSLGVRRSIGYLPENVPLYPEMRVREFLDFRGRLKGLAGARLRERVDHVLGRCWLADVERKVIGTLSKGYRQRVGIADALVGDPPILILDEPTVGLDPNQIRDVRKLVRDLAGEHTVILSTHILSEVEAVCDRVIIIAAGRLVLDDSLAALRASFERDATVQAEVQGPVETVRHALADIPGVRSVEVASVGDSVPRYVLVTEGGRDVREEVYRRVVKGGWTLRDLHREVRTLEDVFVEATVRAATGKANGAAASGAGARGEVE